MKLADGRALLITPCSVEHFLVLIVLHKFAWNYHGNEVIPPQKYPTCGLIKAASSNKEARKQEKLGRVLGTI